MLILGVAAMPAGLLPTATLAPLKNGTIPVLGFVLAVTVVATLATDAGGFA